MRGVRIGPSAVKLLLDALLAVTAARLARARRYGIVHSTRKPACVAPRAFTLAHGRS